MSFTAFITYLAFVFIRPFELFAPGLIEYRPMLILWLITLFLGIGQAISTKQVAARPAHFVLMALLMLAVSLSSLTRDGIGAAFSSVNEFLPHFSLLPLVVLNLTNLKRLRTACVVAAVCMFALCIAGINAYHTGFMVEEFVLKQNVDNPEKDLTAHIIVDEGAPPAQDRSGTAMWRVRGIGFLNDPNDFAQVIIMALPLFWLLYRKGAWIKNVLFILLPSATLGYTIMLTQSRGALIGVGALGLLVFQRLFGTVAAAGAAALGVLGMVGLTYGGGRAMSTGEESAAQRIDAWWEGINLLKSYPLFGAGYGNFTNHHYLTAHNSFVLCFSELGLFGFFAWLGLIVITYKGLTQAMRLSGTPESKAYLQTAELLRFAFVGYFVCAWFLSRTYQPITYTLLGLCISAWYCAYTNDTPVSSLEQSEPKVLVPWKASTTFAMFGTIFGVYIFLWISG